MVTGTYAQPPTSYANTNAGTITSGNTMIIVARFFPVRSDRTSLPATIVAQSAAPSSPNWLSVSPDAGSRETSANRVVAGGRVSPLRRVDNTNIAGTMSAVM